MAKKKKQKQGRPIINDAIIPALLEENKYFDESLDDAISAIEAGSRVHWRTVHHMRDSEGKEVAIPLKLRIAGGAPSNPLGWQIALIAGERIDGFDFETRFCDIYEVERHGWHRHVWSPVVRAASGKTGVTIFNRPGITFRDFVVQALKHMKVFYRKDGDSSGNLSF